MNVLVANGDERQRVTLATLLEGLGHQASVAKDGLEVLELLRTAAFDALIASRQLPLLNAFDLRGVMKPDLSLREIPVIVYAEKEPTEEERALARGLGIQCFIYEPLDSESLQAVFKRIRPSGTRTIRIKSEDAPKTDSSDSAVAHLAARLEEKSRQLAELESDRHGIHRLEALVDVLSTTLGAAASEEFDSSARTALQLVGESLAADRCYLYRIQPPSPKIVRFEEWCVSGVAPRPNPFKNMPLESYHWLTGSLKQHGFIRIPSLQNIPLLAVTEKELLPKGVHSLLAVPVKIGERLHGLLGVDAVRDSRVWTPPEISLLKACAGMLGIAWAGEETARQYQLFQTVADQAAEIILITDAKGTITYVNPALENTTGFRREDVLGKNPRVFKSGRQSPIFYQEMWKSISAGKTWRGLFVNKRKDGTLYTENAVIQPVKNKKGKIHHFVAVKRDITQESSLERQLVQSQKMEAIGTLAGGIAHDFNNILSAILGYAELALYELPEQSRVREDIAEVINAGNRARDLVKQILTFSRKQEQEYKPLDITPLFKEALKFLRASLPSTIEIKSHVDSDTAGVMCNPTQIQQVLMNLCTNAAQSMKNTGGILDVSLNTLWLDVDDVAKLELKPGNYVRLTVQDSGPGIEPNIVGRIFDPYFTTKEKGEGTGLGLSVVHGIVKTLKGAVTVDSSLDQGTTFHVFLPSATGKAPSPEERKGGLPGGTERILLVDDEKALAVMGRLMLERLGYAVTVKTSSREALKTFAENPAAFDLVISDKTMPRMTGFDLALQIKERRPDVPIIVCTGYSNDIELEKASSIGIDRLLMKPLSMDDLAGAVRSVLDSKAQGGKASPQNHGE